MKVIVYKPVNGWVEDKKFIRKMNEMNFEVKTKPVKEFKNGSTKANMDVELTIDAVTLADKMDKVYLVSMDGDFAPLIKYLKSQRFKS